MTKHLSIYLLAMTVGLLTASAQEASVLSAGRWWKMAAEGEGIHRVTTREVSALEGVSIDSVGVYGGSGGMLSQYNRLTPTKDLQPVAVDIVDHNGNGRFDSDDELLFYGEGAGGWSYDATRGWWRYAHHAYATENYYYLTTTARNGRRIATASAVAATTETNSYTAVAHVDNELNNIFATGQRWVGEKFSTGLSSRNFTLTLPGNSDGAVRLRYAVASRSTATSTFTMSTTGHSQTLYITPHAVCDSVSTLLSTPSTHFTFTLNYTPGESTGVGYLDYIEASAHAPLTFGGGQLTVRNDQHLGGAARYRVSGTTAGLRVWEVSRAGEEREMVLNDGVWCDSTTEARRYVLFDGSQYLTPQHIMPIENQNLHGSDAAELVVVCTPTLLEQGRRVATLHELFDGISTLTVTDEEVYNEFSSGKQDPMAVRALLRHLKSVHGDMPPRYLLLMGKGTYDNRNILGGTIPTVVTYETAYSFDEDGQSYASDDMMGYLGENGYGYTGEALEVSVGRLPAKSVEEATLLVDKVEGYLTKRDWTDENERGDWRNYVALLADDADPGKPYDTAFVHSSEVVARYVNNRFPELNVEKLYADSYHQSSGAIGSYYPDLNNALRKRINKGCLLLNYIGHGSTAYIGTERYLSFSDIDAFTNIDRLPLFVTSTCSYGRYDYLEGLCGAEACILARGAMMGVISASRPISHTERFNSDVILYALDSRYSIGDALRMAKNRTPVSPCIGLIGDPALRLSRAANRVVVTHVNRRAVTEGVDDTATVLSRVTVSGEIQDSTGALITDFDGTLYPIVFDRTVVAHTLANDNPETEVAFTQQKNILYRGNHEVRGGRFEYSFVVPMDVAYQYDYAKLSHYARSAGEDASGCYNQLLIGGMNEGAEVTAAAPKIRLFMGDTNFHNGGITDPNPTLIALLSDSAGINAGTGLGHDITAMIDGNPGSMVVLNDLYESDVTCTGGEIYYTFRDLTPGRHTLTLKAWNIYNISSTATIDFVVHDEETLSLSSLFCWPNPASEQARFQVETNNTTKIASAEMQIYNTYGQCVWAVTPTVSADGYTVGPVVWNLGNVTPGLYVARMIVTDEEGNVYQQSTKCIVR